MEQQMLVELYVEIVEKLNIFNETVGEREIKGK
jgi:hypothetical protein